MTPPTVQPRITKISTYIHTDIPINHTGYGVSDYFRLAVIEVQKQSKMPHLMAASLLYISARITKFYEHIHADLPYIYSGYDVI